MKRTNKIINFLHMVVVFIVITGSVLWSYGCRFGLKQKKTPGLDYGTGNMFDLIATRYDFINRVLALNMDMSWRRRMIQELKLKPGDRVLDLATGTADVAILLATEGNDMARMNGSGDETCAVVDGSDSSCGDEELIQVLGLDPSHNMIAVGKEKVVDKNLGNVVQLDIADARALDVKDNSFDKVTMAFGIRNVPEREAVLCEIHRVLNKKRGNNSKFAILEFSEPDENCK